MDTQEKIKQKKNPRETANILSICFFWYFNIFSWEKSAAFLTTGGWTLCWGKVTRKNWSWRICSSRERQTSPNTWEASWKSNIFTPNTQPLSILLCFYVRHWFTELHKAERKPEYKPSLAKAIIRSFGPFYLSLGIYTLIEECFIRIFQPLFMGKITDKPNDYLTVILQAGW